MADLAHLSLTTGPEPVLGTHLATKNYVDAQSAVRTVTSSTRTASYSLVVGDLGVEQVYNSTTAGTFTLPTNASQAVAIGKAYVFRQSGTGQLTIAGASGVTLQARGSAFKLAGQYAVAEARKIASDTWFLYGDIAS